MKTLKFFYSGRVVGSLVEEIVEVPDNTSDDEISEIFNAWLYDMSGADWEEI